MILMQANPLLGPLEEVGPKILYFFGPKWHLLRSLTFQGPKKPNSLATSLPVEFWAVGATSTRQLLADIAAEILQLSIHDLDTNS
jgi:hypothetical protein